MHEANVACETDMFCSLLPGVLGITVAPSSSLLQLLFVSDEMIQRSPAAPYPAHTTIRALHSSH